MAIGKKVSNPNANKLASAIIEKSNLSASGAYGDNNVSWLISQSVGDQDLSKLKDAVSSDWRLAQEKANKLHSEIYKKTKLIEEYSELKMRELCAEADASFALGFAAAVRLLGK